jgi:hypothetical protein
MKSSLLFPAQVVNTMTTKGKGPGFGRARPSLIRLLEVLRFPVAAEADTPCKGGYVHV